MIRDPFAHFIRSYEKKSRHHGDSEVSFLFAPTWKERNSSELPDDLVPLSEFVVWIDFGTLDCMLHLTFVVWHFGRYAHKAFWRWNVFSRSLVRSNFALLQVISRFLLNKTLHLRPETILLDTF